LSAAKRTAELTAKNTKAAKKELMDLRVFVVK
jgi:hypothetical protein